MGRFNRCNSVIMIIKIKAMLQEYQIRMLEEYKQLDDRVEKLDKFINESPVFFKMEVHKQMLQRWQLSAMKSYRDALKRRCLAEGFSPLTGDGME